MAGRILVERTADCRVPNWVEQRGKVLCLRRGGHAYHWCVQV
jgi:hypothetical protein